MLGMTIAAFFKIYDGTVNTTALHPVLGFIIFVAMFLLVVGGCATGFAKSQLRGKTRLVKMLRFVHGSFGALMIFAGCLNVGLGIKTYTTYRGQPTFLAWLLPVIFAVIFVGCEILF